MSPEGPAKQWARSTTSTKNHTPPAEVELITDVTASNGPNRETSDFTRAQGGCFDRWQVYDRSNHLRNSTTPSGGNILFLDGHVTWRKFQEMELRWPYLASGNPSMWW
jgi:prepilin-type processing-associated H-X9-DG protein